VEKVRKLMMAGRAEQILIGIAGKLEGNQGGSKKQCLFCESINCWDKHSRTDCGAVR